MKTKTHVVLFLTAIITLAAGNAFGAYSGGTGEPDDPYRIATKADLLALAADTSCYSKCFILTADVNMTGQVFTMAIIAAIPSNDPFLETWFTGTFDGNGHKITNFNINGEDNSYLGLFGYLSSQSSVKNLGLENFAVSGSSDSQNVGGLAGVNGGSITNCYSTGMVNIPSGSGTGHSIGGLVGSNGGSVRNCHVTGSVSGYYVVGGLAGRNGYGIISNCYSTGAVSGAFYTGGLVGESYFSNISFCYSTGVVNGSKTNAFGVGGLVGDTFNDDFSNCYSTCTVNGSGEICVGGLIGINESNITNCYSVGPVSGSSDVGGLVGYNNNGSTNSSFWDRETSGQTTSAGGIGLNTTQMMQQASFTGWDFTTIWAICEGTNYPRLRWQIPAGDWVCPDGVNMEDISYFVQRWLESDCTSSNNYCGGADMDASGVVDFKDFALFASHWLEGVTP
jgi:hypothetical protein